MNFSCFENLQSVHCANSALQRNLSVRFQLGSCKQSHYKQALTVFTREEEEGNPRQTDRPSWVNKPPGQRSLPALRPGRCPWCCRRHSEHKRLTFCPCGSGGRPPNVKQNVAPHPTFNTNNYPGPSSLSPSRSLQADCSSKSFCFFLLGPTLGLRSSRTALKGGVGEGEGGEGKWGWGRGGK